MLFFPYLIFISSHCTLCFSLVLLYYTFFFFFLNDTATTEIYTLSLHDALPIFQILEAFLWFVLITLLNVTLIILKGNKKDRKSGSAGMPRPISYAVFCLKKKKILKSDSGTTDIEIDLAAYVLYTAVGALDRSGAR